MASVTENAPMDSDSPMENSQKETNEERKENQRQFAYTIDNKVLLIMKPYSKFHFIGKLKVKVLYGCADIFGYTANPSSKELEVYSPSCYSFISIQSASDSNKDYYDLSKVENYLTTEGVDLDILCSLIEILAECTTDWTILLLENFNNTLTHFLDLFSYHQLFPKLEDKAMHKWNSVEKAELTLQAHLRLNDKAGDEIVMPHYWKNEIALRFVKKDLLSSTRSRLVVFGGKNVGKSTAIRYLINQSFPLTQKKAVILLDLDPGQTECTPPGSISLTIIKRPLLGPNFTHLQKPYREIAVGQVDVGQCISHYLNCVANLVDTLNNDEKLKGLSVIVNTMGFCRGIGEDIACAIIKLVRPNDVIQIDGSRKTNNFPNCLVDNYVNKKNLSWISGHLSKDILDQNYDQQCFYDFQRINSNVQKSSDSKKIELTPFQLREIVLLSYLSQITANIPNALYDPSLLSIQNVTPYSVSFSSIYVSLTRTAVPSTHVLSVINGNVVALCGVDVEQVQNDVDTVSEGVKVFIRPPVATCYGHGIVRGVDVENQLIFINTPMSLNTLKQVNCLLGCTPTPLELLQLNERDKPYAGQKNDHLPTSRNVRRGVSFGSKQQERNKV